jgi:hypothetical protein
MRDMARKGRGNAQTHPELLPRGAAHHNAKLTEDQVRDIRALYATGQWRQRVLSDTFGVSQASIEAILKRKTWQHVD